MMRKLLYLLFLLPVIAVAQDRDNIVLNPTFTQPQADPDDWEWTCLHCSYPVPSGYDPLTRTPDGSGSFKLFPDPLISEVFSSSNETNVPQGVYTLTYYVRGKAGDITRPIIDQPSAIIANQGDDYTIQVDDTWEEVTQEFRINEGDRLLVRMLHRGSSAFPMYFDDLSLIKNDYANEKTEYSFTEDNDGFHSIVDGVPDVDTGTGILTWDMSGADYPKLEQSDFYVNADANAYMHIRMKNNTINSFMRISIDQLNNPDRGARYYASKSGLTINASDFEVVTLDLDDLLGSNWTGNISEFRIHMHRIEDEPASQIGNIEIEWVIFSNSPDPPTLGVENIVKEDVSLQLYPNPTTGKLQISSLNKIENVEVYNLLGQRSASFEETNSIDVSNLSKGVYILKIHQEGEVISTKKLVKE